MEKTHVFGQRSLMAGGQTAASWGRREEKLQKLTLSPLLGGVLDWVGLIDESRF